MKASSSTARSAWVSAGFRSSISPAVISRCRIAEETVWIIFNGEIYNLQGAARRAPKQGHQFRTSSDTEVIIHGYKEWGADVFEHLNGMFGLAIWDVLNERLVVARDAMGIKLVYYRVADGRLTFGSEIRAVLAADDPLRDRSCCGQPVPEIPLHAVAVHHLPRHA